MTGVQRYAHEIVAALDQLLAENRDAAAGLAMRLVLPPGAKAVPSLLKTGVPLALSEQVLDVAFNFGPIARIGHLDRDARHMQAVLKAQINKRVLIDCS